MRCNLELKVIDPDPPATLQAALGLDGVADCGVLHQRDTYFNAPSGRLKLREETCSGAQLIGYRRSDRRAPAASTFRIASLPDPAPVLALLSDTLGVRAIVTKGRRLLWWQDVRIHLDAVDRLGAFVELEARADLEGDLAHQRLKVDALRRALGIDDDLLTGQRLRRAPGRIAAEACPDAGCPQLVARGDRRRHPVAKRTSVTSGRSESAPTPCRRCSA